MYLHISNICINLAEQLRDITNLEVAPDTDQGYKIMTNEEKLNEAMKLFQEWSTSYSDELVTINSSKYTIEVTLFHDCTEGVALLVINAVNQKILGQKAAYVNKLRSNKKWAISIIWEKED